VNRREFSNLLVLSALPASASGNFFRVGQRLGHWWFFSPAGEAFFSIGMNHIDPAVLLYPENLAHFREKYGSDRKCWLQTRVVPDLQSWGFNTIGWAQEVVLRTKTDGARHSRSFTWEEYQWAGMPYCHMLPFLEAHEWDYEQPIPDFFGSYFEDWCDFVARSQCALMAGDPKLVGYFYVDCPTWVHTRTPKKPPIFDPALLESESGRKKLFDLATRYYKLTHDAVRRYDPSHLILGDRYEAKARLPQEVLRAAAPYIDVLSFQYFDDQTKICPDFERWHALTGLPILLADAPVPGRGDDAHPEKYSRNYEPLIRGLRETRSCVGWHLCGAYLKNRVRQYGFVDEREQPNQVLVSAVQKANRETQAYVQELAG